MNEPGGAVVLRAATRAAQPWRNGGGVTQEVARRAHPQRDQDFLWRISIARVDQPGPFSAFPGYSRHIVVIEGAGMRLRVAAHAEIELRPLEPCAFDGALDVAGELPAGPVRDLNLIHDPAHCHARLTIVRGGVAAQPHSSERVLINLAPAPMAWQRGAQTTSLEYLDALWLHAGDPGGTWQALECAAAIEIDLR